MDKVRLCAFCCDVENASFEGMIPMNACSEYTSSSLDYRAQEALTEVQDEIKEAVSDNTVLLKQMLIIYYFLHLVVIIQFLLQVF